MAGLHTHVPPRCAHPTTAILAPAFSSPAPRSGRCCSPNSKQASGPPRAALQRWAGSGCTTLWPYCCQTAGWVGGQSVELRGRRAEHAEHVERQARQMERRMAIGGAIAMHAGRRTPRRGAGISPPARFCDSVHQHTPCPQLAASTTVHPLQVLTAGSDVTWDKEAEIYRRAHVGNGAGGGGGGGGGDAEGGPRGKRWPWGSLMGGAVWDGVKGERGDVGGG